MGIIWFEKPQDGIATFYEGNITLNKTAIENLEDCYSVMLGIDYDKKHIFIKPLSKSQDQRGDIPEKSRYKITIRSSYGRITSKEFMKEISKMIVVDLKERTAKCDAIWDQDQKLLVLHANRLKEDI